jgi:hypothetical protein
MTIVDFIEDNKLTDKKVLRAATGAPDCMPDEFLPKVLYPIGVGQFNGDKSFGDLDNQLECGKVYAIYKHEGQRFVIGENAKGLKFVPGNFKEIVWF